MRKVMKIVLILLGVILILLIAGFLYIKSKLPNGGGNNDVSKVTIPYFMVAGTGKSCRR